MDLGRRCRDAQRTSCSRSQFGVDGYADVGAERPAALVHDSAVGRTETISVTRQPDEQGTVEGPSQVQDEVPRADLVQLRPRAATQGRHHDLAHP